MHSHTALVILAVRMGFLANLDWYLFLVLSFSPQYTSQRAFQKTYHRNIVNNQKRASINNTEKNDSLYSVFLISFFLPSVRCKKIVSVSISSPGDNFRAPSDNTGLAQTGIPAAAYQRVAFRK